MFTRVSNASKVAFVHLVRQLSDWSFKLIDCQVLTGHLLRMGAEQIPRPEFIRMLDRWCPLPDWRGCWDDGRQIPVPVTPSAQRPESP
jgi:leucyl/phenylalanyl-tRNA--protein transferase